MPKSRHRSLLRWLLVGLCSGGLAYLLIKTLPQALADTTGLTANQRAADIGRVRTDLLTLIGGSVALVGAIFTVRTYELSRSGQNTDRFSRAIDQLNEDNSTTVRLGGIYALGQLLSDAPKYYVPIVDVLTALARDPGKGLAAADGRDACEPTLEPPHVAVNTRLPITPEKQAIVEVLARRPVSTTTHEHARVDLASADLRGTTARSLVLTRARLRRACLQDVVYVDADFSSANLVEANLTNASLRGANLAGAVLTGALIVGADFSGATTDNNTRWDGAVFDAETAWPDAEFNPEAHGAIPMRPGS